MRRSSLLALLAAATLALPLRADDPPSGGPGPGPGKGGPHEAFKMIDAYLLANVQDALGLSDEQNTRVVPLVLKLQSDRRGFHRRRGKALGEMKRLLGSGSATEPRIAEEMKALRVLEGEELETIRHDVEAIDKELTVVQQAKYRILEREVERKIQNLIFEHRKKMIYERGERGPRPDRQGGPDAKKRRERPDGAEDSASQP